MRLRKIMIKFFLLHHGFLILFVVSCFSYLQSVNELNSAFAKNHYFLTLVSSLIVESESEKTTTKLMVEYVNLASNKLYEKHNLGDGYVFGLLNENSQIVISTDKSLMGLRFFLTDELHGRININDKAYIYNSLMLGNSMFHLFILEERRNLINDIRDKCRWFIIVVLIYFFLDVAFCGLFSRKVSYPLEDIRKYIASPASFHGRKYLYEEANALVRTLQLYKESISEKLEKLQFELNTDTLTCLGNRRAFKAMIKKRQALNFSIIAIDIDDFKTINDAYGHHVGDLVIGSVSRVLRELCNEYDNAYRFGGEEFIVFSQGTDMYYAQSLANKIVLTINRVEVISGQFVSVSAGLYHGDCVSEIAEALEKADKALYAAKNMGKNRVCIHS